ncbi:MAG: sulfotransferase [Planctomycetota bacterium]
MLTSPSSESADFEFAPFNHPPFYTPTIWQGMRIRHWLQLAAKHRFRIDRQRLWKFLYSLTTSFCVPTGMVIQKACFGRRAQETPMVNDPVFVIGHWRSGTTFLHELLTLDDQFRAPTTFQAFCPLVSLFAEGWFKPLTCWTIPSRRPMDNMDFGWDTAQEDEFAIVSMGLGSSYRRLAFPNEEEQYLEYLNMEGVSSEERDHWKQTFDTWIRFMNLHYKKRLALKSPPHTGRIALLLEMYPNAKFIHITRDPQRFIPSTMHLWAALERHNAMQEPKFEHLRDHVFDAYTELYKGFFRDEHLLNAKNSATVQFHDLVANPITELTRVYEALDLGSLEQTIPKLKQRMTRDRNYQRNIHKTPPKLQGEIAERCAVYAERFGYISKAAAA